MQMNTRVVTGTVVVVAAVVLVAWYLTRGGDDNEAPIYVKNGSLDIWSGDPKSTDPDKHWKWTEDSGKTEWKHEPSKGSSNSSKDDFYVKVITTTQPNACDQPTPFSGKMVDLEYTYDDAGTPKPFGVKLKRSMSGGVSSTRIQPHQDLVASSQWLLQYAKPGHISSLVVQGGGPKMTCTFENEADLEIRICAGPGRAECK